MDLDYRIIYELVGLIVGAVMAWELKERLKIRNKKLDVELQDGIMSTSMFISDGHSKYKKTAEVRLEENDYLLEIISEESGVPVTTHSQRFNSREALEHYLNETTSFRLGDFVRR
jgi:hypothetical protein